MNHLLCFGFGFSASTLAGILGEGWKITGTSRSDEGVSAINALGFCSIRFDQLVSIPGDVTHVLSSVPPSPEGDPVIAKFGPELLRDAKKFHWVAYLSTTGVYGDHQGGLVTEETPLTPNTQRGAKRLAAERQWQAIENLPLHVFRLPGIYGPGRNALEALKSGTAKRVIKQGQVFSRIHVSDIAGVLKASMGSPRPGGIYNVADDEPCPPQDVITFAAKLLHREPPPEIPFDEAELSPMAKSFYEDSKRVSNARLKTELNYRLLYRSYREGLTALLRQSEGPAPSPPRA